MSTPNPTVAASSGPIPWTSYLYHESIGVVFVAIPKVGCTTVKRWFLGHVMPGVLEQLEVDVHKVCAEELTLACRPREEAERLLLTKPTVAFVRDPADRLRSAFVDKFVRAGPDDLFAPARELLVDFYPHSAADIARGLTFREFVDYVCHAREDLLDEHWRPQAAFLRHKPIDALLPLENMAIVLRSMSMLLGKSISSVEPTSVTRKEPAGRGLLADAPSGDLHRANLRPPLSELADSGLLNRIHALLAEDLSLHKRAAGQTAIDSLLAGMKFGGAPSS